MIDTSDFYLKFVQRIGDENNVYVGYDDFINLLDLAQLDLFNRYLSLKNITFEANSIHQALDTFKNILKITTDNNGGYIFTNSDNVTNIFNDIICYKDNTYSVEKYYYPIRIKNTDEVSSARSSVLAPISKYPIATIFSILNNYTIQVYPNEQQYLKIPVLVKPPKATFQKTIDPTTGIITPTIPNPFDEQNILFLPQYTNELMDILISKFFAKLNSQPLQQQSTTDNVSLNTKQ